MKILAFLILFYTPSAFSAFCMGTPKIVSANEFARQVINLPANGVLRVELGTQSGELSEVYQGKGTPFSGLSFDIAKQEDSDDRSAIWKWLRPKKLNPPTYALIFKLRDPYIKDILGVTAATTNVTVRVSLDNGRQIQGDLVFNSYLSVNCQP